MLPIDLLPNWDFVQGQITFKQVAATRRDLQCICTLHVSQCSKILKLVGDPGCGKAVISSRTFLTNSVCLYAYDCDTLYITQKSFYASREFCSSTYFAFPDLC